MNSFFKKKTVIFVSIIFILVAIGIVYVINSSFFPGEQEVTEETPATAEVAQDTTPKPIPQPRFATWKESDQFIFAKARPKNNSNRYILKTDYRPEEISRLVSVFNTNEQHNQSGEYHLYTEASDEASILLFNTKNGSITYTSTAGIPLTDSVENEEVPIEDTIFTFLRSIGVYDNSLRINATYSKQGHENITYYELHRDWEVMGYPILNPIGILNIDEETLLHELSYYSRTGLSASDPRIQNTSDNSDGQARANDFNTITVGIDKETGNLVSLDSNMRTLLVNTAYSNAQIISREEAFQELKEGNYQFFITEPSGEGDAPYSKVYPDNIASSNEAVITEVLLTYLEKPMQIEQSSLEPYYLFRGYSMLDSGYRVSFYAAVSAIQGLSVTELSFSNNTQVAGVMAQVDEDSSQKQGTLDFPTAAPTRIPTITQSPSTTPLVTTTSTPSITEIITSTIAPSITSSISPTIAGKQSCEEQTSQYLENFIEFEGMIFAKEKPVISKNLSEGNRWVYVLKENESYKSILADIDSFMEKFTRFVESLPESERSQANLNGTVRMIDEIKSDIHVLQFDEVDELNYYDCILRVTGYSPSLFLYGTDQTEYTLSVGRKITYSDPVAMNTAWKITPVQDGLVINNVERPYLYYEYESVPFEKPTEGWVIAKDDLTSFVKKLGNKMQLTQKEEARLQDEFTIALANSSDPYYFIGKISEIELQEKVPLMVNPQVKNVTRFHLYIEPRSSYVTIQNPTVSPIERSPEMILEIGAVYIDSSAK